MSSFAAPSHETRAPAGGKSEPSFEDGLSKFATLVSQCEEIPAEEVANIRELLRQKEAELEERTILLIRSKEALAILGERFRGSQKTLKHQEKRIKHLETALQSKESECEALKVKAVEEKSVLEKRLCAEKEAQNALRESMEAERQHIRKSMEHELSLKKSECEKLTASVAEERETNSQLQSQLEALRKDVVTRDMEIERLRDNACKASQDHDRCKNNLEQSLKQLEDTQELLESERSQRGNIVRRVAQTEASVHKELAAKQEEIEALKLKILSQQRYLKRSLKLKKSTFASPAEKENSCNRNHNSSNKPPIKRAGLSAQKNPRALSTAEKKKRRGSGNYRTPLSAISKSGSSINTDSGRRKKRTGNSSCASRGRVVASRYMAR